MTAKITPPSVSVQYRRPEHRPRRTSLECAPCKSVHTPGAVSSTSDQVAAASGKSRALMFIALDKLNNQGVKQAIIVVPERSIGGSFATSRWSKFGFFYDWKVEPQWNLCNAPVPMMCALLVPR